MNFKPRVVIGYSRPDNSAWEGNIIPHANQIHAAVLVGPDSGRWHMFDPDYVALIKRLRSAGIKAFAYVFSKYGTRPMSALTLDIDRWNQWFGSPLMDGFFVDECSTSESQFPYYDELCAHFAASQGVFLNFGRVPDVKFLELRASLCISERSQADVLSETFPTWVAHQTPERLLVIAYNVIPVDAPKVVAKIKAANVGFYCLSMAGRDGKHPQYGVETEFFLKDASLPTVPPPAPEDPNWASLTLLQGLRAIGASPDSTAKDLVPLITAMKLENANLKLGVKGLTNAQIVADLVRRLGP